MKMSQRCKMRLEIARGSRNCALCEEPIRKGQKCMTMSVAGRQWAIFIHIHRTHVKSYNHNKCKDKLKCVTDQYFRCRTPLCKYWREP